MDKNYTSLDIASFQKAGSPKKKVPTESFDINTVFLSLIVITLAIMALLLYILIQKKVQELGLASLFA